MVIIEQLNCQNFAKVFNKYGSTFVIYFKSDHKPSNSQPASE